MKAGPVFSRALERVTFALALTGFLAVAVTGEMGPITFAYGAVGMALSRLRHRLPWQPTERQWNWSTGFVLGLCIGSWRLVGHDLLPPIVFFTTHLQVLRLFSSRTPRHVLQVFVIGFSMILLSSVLTTTPLVFPLFLAYGFFQLMGLVLLTVRREGESVGPHSGGGGLEALLEGGFSRRIAGTALTLYLLTAIFFIGLPRYQGNDWFSGLRSSSMGSGGSDTTSGFSQSVGLGEISHIRLDNTIVMRVFPESRPGQASALAGQGYLRLRGQGLGHFDGQNWQSTGDDDIKFLAPNVPQPIFGGEDRSRANVRLRVEQERGAPPVFFGQSMPVSAVLLDPFPRNISHNEAGGWSHVDSDGALRRSMTYEVDSIFEGDGPHEPMVRAGSSYRPLNLAGADNPESLAASVEAVFYGTSLRTDQFRPFLATNFWEERLPSLRALAAQWVQEAAAADPVAMANAIERRLRTEYRYTLEPRVIDERFPIAGFLAETHEGHCEYFASSLVLLLRSLGVPARLATGYLTPEWNDAGQFWVVRESHAHAWAEVYAPDRGWLTYDPTPPEGLPTQVALSSWMRLAHWLDAHRHTWYRWVIDLDQNQQVAILGQMGIPFMAWRQALVESLFDVTKFARDGMESGRSFLHVAAWSVVALLVFAVALRLLLRKRRRSIRLARARTRTDIALYYHRLVRWLRRQGFVRPPGATPREFARVVASSRPELAAVAEVTETYYAERYATAPPAEEECLRAAKLVDSLTR